MIQFVKIADKLSAVFDFVIDRVLVALAGVLCLLLMLGISTEVVTRYFFNAPIPGMLEASEIAMLYIAFLAAPWVLKKEAHVSLDILNEHLSPRALSILNVFLSILGAIIAFVLLWYGTKVTIDTFREGTNMPGNMDINIGYQLMIIPFGGFFLFIQFLRRAYGYWKKSKKDKI